MHYAKDTKEYYPKYNCEEYGLTEGVYQMKGPFGIRQILTPPVKETIHEEFRISGGPEMGRRGVFRGPHGGGYGAGGYPLGAHGYGNRWRYNYPVGYRYPIGYNYPIYPAFPSLCTEINKDPFATGVQIECCPGLTQCLADWNNDNNPYYLCKKSCDE